MKVLLLALALGVVRGDIYMHNPRGSNNRLDENTANRQTGNRVFDSQNNERGGYNVGDRTDQPFRDNYDNQFHMLHFMSAPDYKATNGKHSSYLDIEWTNQHACGGTGTQPNMFCQVVIQYLCRPDSTEERDSVRDGTSTSRQDYEKPRDNERQREFEDRKRNKNRNDRALHESFEWYDKCIERRRNRGLFAADQQINRPDSTGTRQNPNGNRNGYECPEERDYYPYWHPSEWKDMAVLAENVTMCQQYYKKESFNVRTNWECMEKWRDSNEYRHYSEHNNKQDCENRGGLWLEFTNYLERAPQHETPQACAAASGNGIKFVWARPMGQVEMECLVALEAPDCKKAPWSRDNHLGDVTEEGQNMNYRWEVPYFPSEEDQRCVVRIRYNISTNDFDPYRTDASYNENGPNGPVIENNPEVDMGVRGLDLQLAINTAQFSRTFQDRSHYTLLSKRPTTANDKRIFNVNVRGKRGNIVQVYPAVEYDFVPMNLEINQEEDLVHFQWTGSNTHNNNGQGDDGEGRGGTDRSNIVQISDRNDNYPLLFDESNMFKGAKALYADGCHPSAAELTDTDIMLQMATSGYVECERGCKHNAYSRTMQDQLDNAPASFGGLLLSMKAGSYNYMSSRNNNFSNRSQKGTLIVKA